jgi:hypothetical protein
MVFSDQKLNLRQKIQKIAEPFPQPPPTLVLVNEPTNLVLENEPTNPVLENEPTNPVLVNEPSSRDKQSAHRRDASFVSLMRT